MAHRREFEIAFVGLKPGPHEFNYTLGNEFFIERGAVDFSDIDARVKVTLDKHPGFLQLKFEVGGQADVQCDRCGNPLTLDLWDDFDMVVKLVENPDEMNASEEDPDIFYIGRQESHIDLSNWLYDFVLLSIPVQRMCKEDADGHSGCNPDVIQKLKEMEERTRENNAQNIWKDLDKFKQN
ncbi:MAG: DUF177 domain-containing protein [Ferruginibacter sp.]|nr:DUF177 domain-containing protein [Ferruginibacter sp.]